MEAGPPRDPEIPEPIPLAKIENNKIFLKSIKK